MIRRLDQFHPSLTFGDAVSNHCFELARTAWTWQLQADVFAQQVLAPELRPLVRDYHELPTLARPEHVLFLHHSMGHDVVDEVARFPNRKVVVYHNITPAEHFAGVNEYVRHYAEVGRRQLRDLAGVAELGLGVSEYNRKELEAVGFGRTAVVPLAVDWSQYEVMPDAAVLRRLASTARTNILYVGQLLPHKGIRALVTAFAHYRAADPGAHLYLVGSAALAPEYRATVEDDVQALGLAEHVTFAGRVSFEELLAYYRGATVFVTLSEHEGFCLPVLEAMRADLPVVAHAAAAIPDTVGDAGLLVDGRAPDEVAAALERAARDAELRRDLVAKGRRRLAEFTAEEVAARLRQALVAHGLDPAAPRIRSAVVLSAPGGPAEALASGLRAIGVEARAAALADDGRVAGGLPVRTDVAVVEHDFRVHRTLPFLKALARLRLRGSRVVVGFTDLSPERFHQYRALRAVIETGADAGLRAVLGIFLVPTVLALRYALFRAIVSLFGAIPDRLVVHSAAARAAAGILTAAPEKVVQAAPLVWRTHEPDRAALRAALGLDGFVYVSVGALEPRRRLRELHGAVPPDATLVLAGEGGDPAYVEQLRGGARPETEAAGRPSLDRARLVVDTDAARAGAYLAAADCVVVPTAEDDVYAAPRALGAGVACVLADTPDLRAYEPAALFAADDAALRDALRAVREPETAARLRRSARILRRLYDAARNAPRYVAGL